MSVNWEKAEKAPNKSQRIENQVLLDFRSEINDLAKKILASLQNTNSKASEHDDLMNIEEDNQRFIENLPINWDLVEENPFKSYKLENRFLLNISSQINDLKRILHSF